VSKKFAFALLVILFLFPVDRGIDYKQVPIVMADDMMNIIRKKPLPDDIWEVIGQPQNPQRVPWKFGKGEINWEISFTAPHDGILRYTLYITDNMIMTMAGGMYFNIQRGVTYDALEKIFVDKLTEYFSASPDETEREIVDPGKSRNKFTWRVKHMGAEYDFHLYIIHDKRSLAHPTYPRFLWEKLDDVYVSLYFERQFE
jgi:hypothetical protein